jgi:hypothetical protein
VNCSDLDLSLELSLELTNLRVRYFRNCELISAGARARVGGANRALNVTKQPNEGQTNELQHCALYRKDQWAFVKAKEGENRPIGANEAMRKGCVYEGVEDAVWDRMNRWTVDCMGDGGNQ